MPHGRCVGLIRLRPYREWFLRVVDPITSGNIVVAALIIGLSSVHVAASMKQPRQ